MSEQANTAAREAFQAEFEALPLDEKFARLFKLEVATLGETFKQLEDSAGKTFEKVGEVLGDFGKKVDTEFKKAACGENAATESAPKADEPVIIVEEDSTEGHGHHGSEVN